MAQCKGFNNFKERGEWVEMRFMAQAMGSGFLVSKPWGESSAYDVGVEYEGRFLRVQVKSTARKLGAGYFCVCKPSPGARPYTLKLVDFFALYVIDTDRWYLIPASVVLRTTCRALMLNPVRRVKYYRYKYEDFREAWMLMKGARGRRAWLKKVKKLHGSLAGLPKPVRKYARTIARPKRRRAAA